MFPLIVHLLFASGEAHISNISTPDNNFQPFPPDPFSHSFPCSDIFSCEITDDNFVGQISNVETEILCQNYCLNTPLCNLYTWFDKVFSNPCLMFSSCEDKDFSCSTCHSGPPHCDPCDRPQAPDHGDWFCHPSTEPATCHLECHPGYVSNNATVVVCKNGRWSEAPYCVSAVALVTGGYPSGSSVEVYGEDLHMKLPSLPYFAYRHSLELVNSALLLCGGYYIKSSCLTLTASHEWVSHSKTTSPRDEHASVSILGQLHLLGGMDPSSQSTTEHLTPPSHLWTRGWNLSESNYESCAAKIDPEVFILTGGDGNSRSAVSYNVTSGVATRLQDTTEQFIRHGCVHVRDVDIGFRGVLVAGGYYGKWDHSEIYDIEAGLWTSAGRLATGRPGVRLVVLGAEILAMGGPLTSSVDRFNLTTRTWGPGRDMLETREYHAVTGVPSSAVGIQQL